eukprot:scaffold368_cov258-Pinguiococcus_pyrenoidosus.AAC.49
MTCGDGTCLQRCFFSNASPGLAWPVWIRGRDIASEFFSPVDHVEFRGSADLGNFESNGEGCQQLRQRVWKGLKAVRPSSQSGLSSLLVRGGLERCAAENLPERRPPAANGRRLTLAFSGDDDDVESPFARESRSHSNVSTKGPIWAKSAPERSHRTELYCRHLTHLASTPAIGPRPST